MDGARPAGDAGAEPVEIVDPGGRVVDIVPRARMRAEVLRHRCTYVAVMVGRPGPDRPDGLGPDAEVVVHQRADWKDTCPGFWDIAFGGVCDVGETWLDAATRELTEEAGISGAELHDLGPVRYERADNRVVGRVFITTWPDEPVCGDGEVVAIDRVRLADLGRWAQSVLLCPDSAELVLPRLVALI